MSVPVMQFEAKKHGYRQTQDGIVVSFVVHPNDVSADLAVAPLGTHYVVVVAPYTEQSPPSSTGSEHRVPDPKVGGSSPSADATPHEKRPKTRAEMAGILCNDARFQRWILAQFDERPSADAKKEDLAAASADHVRTLCRVTSRAEFERNDMAASRWDSLHARYLTETGQLPEPRG